MYFNFVRIFMIQEFTQFVAYTCNLYTKEAEKERSWVGVNVGYADPVSKKPANQRIHETVNIWVYPEKIDSEFGFPVFL